MTDKSKKMSYNQIGSLAFVGCMFVGMGIGFYIGNLVPAMFMGMGVGFAFKAILFLKAKEEAEEKDYAE